MLSDLWFRWRALFRRHAMEAELDAELREHFERQVAKHVQSGLPLEAAQRQARLEFGGVDQVKEECRDARGVNLIETTVQDVRYGLRMLAKNPGFAAVAVLTLALGIGANSAIFTVVNTVLLRRLPFPNAERLVMVGEFDRKEPPRLGEVSYPNFQDWRAQNHVFESMAVVSTETFTLSGKGETLHIQGAVVSAELWALLGVRARLGRVFLPEEDVPGGGGRGLPVVLSEAFWRQHFGGSNGVLGQMIDLDNRSFTIVGVIPQKFQFPITAEPIDVWTTIGLDAQSSDKKSPVTAQRETRYLQVVARLKPGITVTQARADMASVARNLERQYPGPDSDTGAWVVPEFEALVGDVRPALLMLFGSAGFLLLIACGNVASLLLARATSRQREIALRSALGAGRTRIVRQLFVESMLLSSLGAAVSLPVAAWGTRLLTLWVPTDVPRIEQVSFDGHVFGFTLLLAVATALVFGLAPAFVASRNGLNESLKSGGLAVAGAAPHNRLRNLLVVGETALSLVLLVSAGLFIHSFWRIIKINPGFDPRDVLTFALDLPSARYSGPQRVRFYRELLPQIEALPGVSSASAIEPLPLSDSMACSFGIEGRPTPQGVYWDTDFHVVALNYFRTMRIPLREGRDFTAQDEMDSLPVAIINRTLAQRYFPGQDPMGKRIKPRISNGYLEAPWRQIVGVVGDVHDRSLSRVPEPEVYVPQAQSPMALTVVVRTKANPRAIIRPVRDVVKSLDNGLPIYAVQTLEQHLAISLGEPRFNALLLGIFSALALALSAVGLYGVISYAVAQRTHEMGVRMALGATRTDVLMIIVRLGLRLALMGTAIGLVAALVLTQALKALLFGVNPADPLAFLSVSLLLVGVALFASYVPARRATKVDPMVALRYE